VLLCFRELIGEEDRIENRDQEGYGSLWGCFKALFGIPLGDGALVTLRPLIAS